MRDFEDNKMAFSPKITQHHYSNSGLSARKNRSIELASATAIIQKCIGILSLVNEDYSKQQYYTQLKDEPDPMPTIAHYIDQIYESVGRLKSKDSQGYDQIQTILQKQQQLNRALIKKELEFREEHKTLYDELTDEKKRINKLNEHISKLNEEIREKDLMILHLKNEVKAYRKERNLIEEQQGNLGELGFMEKKNMVRSKEMQKQGCNKHGVIKLGHGRRNSEDMVRKSVAKHEPKKKNSVAARR